MDAVGEGTGSRLVAFGIDAVLVGTAWAMVWGVGAAVRAAVDGSLAALAATPSPVGVAVWLVAWVLSTGVAFAYFAGGHAVAGQSLGKRMTDLVVATRDGGPCDGRAAAVRTAVLLAPAPLVALAALLGGLSGAAVGAGLVALWLLVELGVLVADDEDRRLGDRVADTVVAPEKLATL